MNVKPTVCVSHKSSSQIEYQGHLHSLQIALRRQIRAITLLSMIAVSAFGGQFSLAAEDLVNINLATPEILSESLSGVGVAKAYRIVEYREAYGPFETVDELSEVDGIGSSTVERNRERIVLE